MAALALIFSWVAFGPGERQFSGGISVGPSGVATRGVGGRIAFGFGALLFWAGAVTVTRRLLRNERRD